MSSAAVLTLFLWTLELFNLVTSIVGIYDVFVELTYFLVFCICVTRTVLRWNRRMTCRAIESSTVWAFMLRLIEIRVWCFPKGACSIGHVNYYLRLLCSCGRFLTPKYIAQKWITRTFLHLFIHLRLCAYWLASNFRGFVFLHIDLNLYFRFFLKYRHHSFKHFFLFHFDFVCLSLHIVLLYNNLLFLLNSRWPYKTSLSGLKRYFLSQFWGIRLHESFLERNIFRFQKIQTLLNVLSLKMVNLKIVQIKSSLSLSSIKSFNLCKVRWFWQLLRVWYFDQLLRSWTNISYAFALW